MSMRKTALSALGALALAACADETTMPVAPSAAPSLAVAGNDAGTYLVRFKGNGIPSGFAAQVAALGGEVIFAHAGAGIGAVSGLSEAGASQIAAIGGVGEVRPDVQIWLDKPAATIEADASAVQDPSISSQANPTTASRYTWQWNMRLIGADKAWAAGKLGSSGVTVAILDTGIDYDAPDLNGLVDLSRSASFVPTDNAITETYFPTRHAISDYHGHGTNVATQVSSKAVALAGVTSKTTLIGVKVLGQSGGGTTAGVLQGVLWAADHGADVINMSLGGAFTKAGGGGTLVSLINQVFNYTGRKGVVIVVAAGNELADLDHDLIPNDSTGAVEHFPSLFKTYCDAPHVVCVSSVGPATVTDNPDTPAYYTNFGRSAISVAGPGGNADAENDYTLSAWPWGIDIASWVWSFCSKTRIDGFAPNGAPILTACAAGNRLTGNIGTSQATPHVAGLAALLVAETGRGKPAQIKARIQQSAVDLGQSGTDPYYGNGRINVARALGL